MDIVRQVQTPLSKEIAYRNVIGGLSKDIRKLRKEKSELQDDLADMTRNATEWKELAESLKKECIRLSEKGA